MTARFAVWTLLLVLLTMGAGCTGPAANGTHTPSGAVLVVDNDGGANYTSIQAAVDAASPGDTVQVRPGTYHENITVGVNVTLVAPQGATLDGSDFGDDAAGIEIGENATVVLKGFTITDYTVGVDAAGATGDWLVRNTTIRNTAADAITAVYSTGDWRVQNAIIRNTTTGIGATYANGDWTVTDTVIRNVTEGHGIDASPSGSDWALDNVTIDNVDFVGVSASYSSGNWLVVNATIRDTMVGIGALETSGDWTVRGSTVQNASVSERYDFMQPPLQEGVGLHAANTNGSWTVHSTRFVDNEAGGIDASGASPTGDATRNWWGNASDTNGEDCMGNVDCSDALSEWPP